jgi:hypothetical protein
MRRSTPEVADYSTGVASHPPACYSTRVASQNGSPSSYTPVDALILTSAGVRIGVTTDELTNVNVVVSAPSTVTVHDSARSLLASRPYDEHRMTTTEPIDANLLVAGRSTTSAGSRNCTPTDARRERRAEVSPASVKSWSPVQPEEASREQ